MTHLRPGSDISLPPGGTSLLGDLLDRHRCPTAQAGPVDITTGQPLFCSGVSTESLKQGSPVPGARPVKRATAGTTP